MAEHGLEGPVLGIAWDGTGYGRDKTVWGGEVMRCQGRTSREWRICARFRCRAEIRQCTNRAARRWGRFIEILGDDAMAHVGDWFSPAELAALNANAQAENKLPANEQHGPAFRCRSGNLRPAAVISFEGQAAMALEFAAEKNEKTAYSFALLPGRKRSLAADWEPVLRGILAAGPGRADWALSVPGSTMPWPRWRWIWPSISVLNNIVLTGGCFQNALLTERVYYKLHKAGFSVYLHKEIPPGDGGIALGQI